MPQDEKVAMQKVFVKLAGVTALAAEWAKVERDLAAARSQGRGIDALIARRQALDFVFNTLELPRA